MMLRKTINITKRSDGFTLVEAMLSVVILGLLAATMGVVYTSANQSLAVQTNHMLLDSKLRSRMEYLMGTPFDTLVDGGECVTINGNNYLISWTVVPIDLDGDEIEESTAKQVTVSLSAGGSGGNVNPNWVVANNGDDAEEAESGGMTLDNDKMELGQMKYVGVRFVGVTIPQGANVIDAYVEFQAADDNTVNTYLTILGEAADNSAGFGTGDNDISGRNKTTAFVWWNTVPKWTINQSYQSPSITSIIQEIVDRSGWSSGYAMTLLFESTDLGGKRIPFSHDHPSGNAPKLHVEYCEGGSAGPVLRSLTTIVVDHEGQVGKIS
jgi:type II secretory pathway pseudopilin PulG